MWERRSLCMRIFVPLRVYHTERGIYSPYLSYRKSKSYVKGKVRNEGLAFFFMFSSLQKRIRQHASQGDGEWQALCGTYRRYWYIFRICKSYCSSDWDRSGPKETAGVQYYPLLSILFRADHFFPYMVSKGYTLTLHDDTWIGYIPSAKGEITNYTRYVSGKIIFQGFSNGIVTLQLDNVTFADKNNQSNVITLNGTLDFEYSVWWTISDNKSCGVADESLAGWRR